MLYLQALLFLIFLQAKNPQPKDSTQKERNEVEQDTVIINSPDYFKYNTKNLASIYLLNTPVKLNSGSTVEFGESTIIKPGPAYPSSKASAMIVINDANNVCLKGGIFDAPGIQDAIIIRGVSKNITVEKITILNATRFGLQVFGKNGNNPHAVKLRSITTKDCRLGGIYVNSADHIVITDCKNDGGIRHIGIESPKPKSNYQTLKVEDRSAHDIEIIRCESVNTTQFGIQLFYANEVLVKSCKVDGSKLIKGDKSCITVDRANNVTLDSDTTFNSIYHNIFITGAENVEVRNNLIYSTNNTPYLIELFYNNEPQEDRVINESKNIRIRGNLIKGGKHGIMVNGVKGLKVEDNTISGAGNYDIYIMKQNRKKDSAIMSTEDVEIKGNIMRDRVFYNDLLKKAVKHLR